MLRSLTSLALAVAFCTPSAAADDWKDCTSAGQNLIIKGCSVILEREGQSPARRAHAFRNRAAAYQAKGELDRAIADYNRAIELDPAYVYAYSNRAAALEAGGDMARALADRAKAAGINPEDAGSLRPRHELAFDDGDLKSASADLLRAAGQTDESSSNSGASRNRSEAEAGPAKQPVQIAAGAQYSRHLRRRLAQKHHARRGARFAHRHQRYKQARASHRSFRAGRDAMEDNFFQF